MSFYNEALPVLVGQGGDYNAHRWVLDDSLIIGRTDDCEIAITNRQISRYHAQFTRLGEEVILVDLDSKNGTFLNGQRIQEPVRLEDGDVIQIALAQKFIFLSKDATIPLDYSEFDGKPISLGSRRMRIDADARRVWVNNNEVTPPLSALQFSLLTFLCEHAGQVLSRDVLINQVWGETEAPGVTDQALDALMGRLRAHLSKADPDHEYVATIRGQGFRLDNPPQRNK